MKSASARQQTKPDGAVGGRNASRKECEQRKEWEGKKARWEAQRQRRCTTREAGVRPSRVAFSAGFGGYKQQPHRVGQVLGGT